MQDRSDINTIHYKIKLKRTSTPLQVFEKMQKKVQKKGATKNWTYTINSENESLSVDFGDEKSETFCLSFDDKKTCEGFCKVFFPLSGELFDDEKKSEFKSLINMIFSAKTLFSTIEITDEYGITESYLDSKKNKIVLRDLTNDETKRAERLFSEGHKDIREFIIALMYDYRDLPYSEDFIPYISKHIGLNKIMFWDSNSYLEEFFPSFVDSFLCETTEYDGKGRLYDINDYYGDMNGTYFSVYAFIDGIENITHYAENKSGWDPKSTQVIRLYYNKYLPLLETEDTDFGKCILAYRFFVSTLDYLKFKYVGKSSKSNDFIDNMLVNGIRAMLYENNRNALEEALAEFWKNNKKYAMI